MSLIYEPAEDSFLLESIIPNYVNGKKVLDVGSGSGILAKKAKESGAKTVIAIDINKDAIKHLKKEKIKAIQSNLFDKIKESFDVIICNPPYLPEEEREDGESKLITTGGKNGDEFILEFFNKSINHLNKHGVILLLLSSLTPLKKIKNSLKKLNLKHKKVISKKIFFETLEVWEITRFNQSKLPKKQKIQ